MKSPQLIVREHDPLKRRVLIVAIIIAVVAAGFLIYDYGRSRANLDLTSLENDRELMHKQNENLMNEIDSLQQKLVASKRGSEIEQQAYSEVDDSLRDLQSEILELKEELAFYRSIVAPRESARGLRIQGFKITPASQDKTFRYKLVLTQVIKNNRTTSGKVEIQIEGVQNGKPRTMNLTEVSIEKKKEFPFKFKYFQNFEGDLIIPDGFVPSRVNVKVTSNRDSLEKTFSWSDTGLSSRGSLNVSVL